VTKSNVMDDELHANLLSNRSGCYYEMGSYGMYTIMYVCCCSTCYSYVGFVLVNAHLASCSHVHKDAHHLLHIILLNAVMPHLAPLPTIGASHIDARKCCQILMESN
jgi:hypothetical protein